jgi:hypothetical protein
MLSPTNTVTRRANANDAHAIMSAPLQEIRRTRFKRQARSVPLPLSTNTVSGGRDTNFLHGCADLKTGCGVLRVCRTSIPSLMYVSDSAAIFCAVQLIPAFSTGQLIHAVLDPASNAPACRVVLSRRSSHEDGSLLPATVLSDLVSYSLCEHSSRLSTVIFHLGTPKSACPVCLKPGREEQRRGACWT